MRKLILLLLCFGVALTQSTLHGQAKSTGSTMNKSFHLSRVGYIMLGVADIHTTLAFYQDKCGLKTTFKSDDVVFLDAGAVSLVLSSAIGKEPGDSEVVFAVEHVQPAFEALTQAGVKFEREPHQVTPSSWAANFRDPDGHILSLFGPK